VHPLLWSWNFPTVGQIKDYLILSYLYCLSEGHLTTVGIQVFSSFIPPFNHQETFFRGFPVLRGCVIPINSVSALHTLLLCSILREWLRGVKPSHHRNRFIVAASLVRRRSKKPHKYNSTNFLCTWFWDMMSALSLDVETLTWTQRLRNIFKVQQIKWKKNPVSFKRDMMRVTLLSKQWAHLCWQLLRAACGECVSTINTTFCIALHLQYMYLRCVAGIHTLSLYLLT